jgi:4-hydroxybenzoate-CoA ligase
MIASRTGENMHHTSIFGYLAKQIEERPDSDAYVYRGGKTTFRELNDGASKLAGALKARGVRPGDRVAMVMQDSIELVLAILAVMGMRAIAVPINPLLSETDICHVVNDSGAKLLFVSETYLDTALKLKPQLQELESIVTSGAARAGITDFTALLESGTSEALSNTDGPAFIVYTSGSTGGPKGALHYQSDICCIVEAIGRKVYEIEPSDRMFSASRTPFAYGFGNTIGFTIGFGAPMILLSERPTPESIARVFAEFDPTIFFAVPAVFRNILEYRRQGGAFSTTSLKFSAAGGENLPPQTFNEWQQLTNTPILETIGSTELLHGYITNQKQKIKLGSTGLGVPGYDIKLIDDQGREGQQGVLFVKGASAFRRYWNNDEKTSETIIDGYVRTGDIYRRDEEGFYFFEGRADDMFKSSGMWVSPIDVEEVLRGHPDVNEAAVVGLPAADGTFEVTAFVALRSGTKPQDQIMEELHGLSSSSLPRYKRPKQIRIVAELPRNPTGKVQRFKLRTASELSPSFKS